MSSGPCAELDNLLIVATGNQALTIPTATISFQIIDSQSQAILVDKTGASAIQFPQALSNLSNAKRLDLLHHIINWYYLDIIQGLS